ncbi:MAG TPA: DUF2934 domain-containing protein [Methylophilaceae bacterium]|nr:DUF2934 domain-containing protein [Methylophilaceae bacterium]
MADTKGKSENTPAAEKTPTARKPRAAGAKPVAEKKPTSRKSAASANASTSTASLSRPPMSPEERYRMVEVAAYYLAERNKFAGSPVEYWAQAEAQISSLLGE